MEIKQSRDLGDTPRTHIHGFREIREQALLNLIEDANAAATRNLGEDANAAAAKEKAKKKGDMPRLQNSKHEKIKEGDDEIRRLIEERRRITKGDRHQLREVSKRIKKVHQRQKRTKRQEHTADSRRIQRHQTITARKGITNVIGEFYSKLYAE